MSDWHEDEAKAECIDLRLKVSELESKLTMNSPDWDRLVQEATVAHTDDYVDRGVLWAEEKLTQYETENFDLTMKLEVSEFLSGEKTKKLTKLEAAIDEVVDDFDEFYSARPKSIAALAALRDKP